MLHGKVSGLPPSEHLIQMMMIARTRAVTAGLSVPRREDWLAALLTFDEPSVSTYLFDVLGVNRASVAKATLTDSHYAWLEASVPNFLQEELAGVARDLGHQYLGPEHLLLRFTRADSACSEQFRAAGLSWTQVLTAFEAIEWNTTPNR